jgi:DNA processing protein
MPRMKYAAGDLGDDTPISVITPESDHWPPLWREIPDPPDSVYVSGNPELLLQPGVAIVGTRRASVRGLAMARALASALAIRGWTIVSGLARGIDSAAHQGALDIGGRTLAVMATGLDRTYPSSNRRLRREIEEHGACLTEFVPGTGPRKFHFPRRNRLIAGLVKAVVVVEAPLKSGALLTAYLGLDYNREIFAVPGPVEMETSRGCHQLLREGAHLLETMADLHAVLNPPSGSRPVGQTATGRSCELPPSGSAAGWIFERLNFDGVSREQLRCQWAGTDEAWSEGMMALELAGLIKRLPGGGLARSIW